MCVLSAKLAGGILLFVGSAGRGGMGWIGDYLKFGLWILDVFMMDWAWKWWLGWVGVK
jgi:hypothetical protein